MKVIYLYIFLLLISCSDAKKGQIDLEINDDQPYQKDSNKFPVKSNHKITNELVDILVTNIDGNDIPLSNVFSEDKNYIVSLMASWCAPCRVELDAFQKTADHWSKNLNTEIVGLSIEKPSDTYKLFSLVKKHGWTMQFFHDKMAYTSRELDVFDIPHTFLVNQNGEIVYATEGFKSNIVSLYETEIKKLQ